MLPLRRVLPEPLALQVWRTLPAMRQAPGQLPLYAISQIELTFGVLLKYVSKNPCIHSGPGWGLFKRVCDRVVPNCALLVNSSRHAECLAKFAKFAKFANDAFAVLAFYASDFRILRNIS
jgi:hypothetical protein